MGLSSFVSGVDQRLQEEPHSVGKENVLGRRVDNQADQFFRVVDVTLHVNAAQLRDVKFQILSDRRIKVRVYSAVSEFHNGLTMVGIQLNEASNWIIVVKVAWNLVFFLNGTISQEINLQC